MPCRHPIFVPPDIYEASDTRPICARCQVRIPPQSPNVEPYEPAVLTLKDQRFELEALLCQGCSGVLRLEITSERTTPWPWEKGEKMEAD